MSPILKPCIARTPRGLCGRLSEGSRCPEHRTEFERARQERQSYRVGYSSARYRAVRARVLRRDGYRCKADVLGPEGWRACGERATEVHHIRPLSSARTKAEARALAEDEENMISVCHDHQPRGVTQPGAR